MSAAENLKLEDDLGAAKSSSREGQFLSFILGGEEYGLDILNVQEIRGWSPVTRIPNTPKFVRGVINLRGLVVPIIDLRRRFMLKGECDTKTSVVIVLKLAHEGNKERFVGLVADAVSDVYTLSIEQWRSAPDFTCELDDSAVIGLGHINEKMIILLNTMELVDSCISEELLESLK